TPTAGQTRSTHGTNNGTVARRTKRHLLGPRDQRRPGDRERARSALANHRGTGLSQKRHRVHGRLERGARARGPRVRVARSIGPDLKTRARGEYGILARRPARGAVDLAGLAPSGSLAPTEWVRLPPGPLGRVRFTRAGRRYSSATS